MFFLPNRKRWKRIKDCYSSLSPKANRRKTNSKNEICEARTDIFKNDAIEEVQSEIVYNINTAVGKRKSQSCNKGKTVINQHDSHQISLNNQSVIKWDDIHHLNLSDRDRSNNLGIQLNAENAVKNSISPNSSAIQLEIEGSELSEELEKGDSDKQLRNILKNLQIDQREHMKSDYWDMESEKKHERTNRTSRIAVVPKMRYDMADCDKNSKVFLSLKKESRKTATPSKRERSLEFDTEVQNGKILRELNVTKSYDHSISSCSLDSSLCSKRHVILASQLSPPPPPPPARPEGSFIRNNDSVRHELTPPSTPLPNQEKQRICQNDEYVYFKGVEAASDTTFVGLVEEKVYCVCSIFMQWFGKCISE